MTLSRWTAAALFASLMGCINARPASATGQGQAGRTTTMTWEQVAEHALKELSPEERRSGATYLDEVELAPGSTITIDQKEVPVRRASAVVFVDKEPQVNWGHACRYLLVDLEDGRVVSIAAQFPPFLRQVPKTLRLIWKGDTVPDWAIAKP